MSGPPYLVNHQYRFIYRAIPKSGCSSLKSWFLGTLGFNWDVLKSRTDTGIHDFVNKNFRCGDPEMLSCPDYFRFAFVRNPYRRVVSAFTDKFLNLQFQPTMRRIQERSGEPVDVSKGVTFRQFVDDLMTRPATEWNPHWMPQTLLLDGFEPDHIGRLETITEDIEYLSRQLKLPAVELPRMNTNPLKLCFEMGHAGSASDLLVSQLRESRQRFRYGDFYDADLRTKVSALYGSDLSQFNYEYDL
jgi:Sulfotransferase family